MSSAERDPRPLASRVTQAAPGLRALSLHERATAIARACAQLGDPRSQAGAGLRTQLRESTGLTAPNIERGLSSSLEVFAADRLLALGSSRARDAPERLVALVLAGNVFSAALRPMLLPLLVGAPVLAKASSNDDALPHALCRALSATHPVLGAACAVLTFEREDRARMQELLASASAVHVLGSDEALAAVRAQLPDGVRFIGRGHGLGIALVEGAPLEADSSARQAASALARDIAAYDQRGCLSPQIAFVRSGAAVTAARFAQLALEALCEQEKIDPRAALPKTHAHEQASFRAIAAARGGLLAAESCAVSYEANAAPRLTPGYRNLLVLELREREGLAERLGPLRSFVKALGITGAGVLDPTLAPLAPYVCALGAMQTPPLEAALDGLHPLEGFTRR